MSERNPAKVTFPKIKEKREFWAALYSFIIKIIHSEVAKIQLSGHNTGNKY